jgi:hypothetical protein
MEIFSLRKVQGWLNDVKIFSRRFLDGTQLSPTTTLTEAVVN